MNGGPARDGGPAANAGPVAAGGDPAGAWHRLHPLSPVVRSGRGVLAVAVAVAITRSATSGSGWLEVAFLFAAVVAAVISWLVTRWRLDGVTLRIESGLIRRDSRQLPIARIQAGRLVRPVLARALGLAELRGTLAGSTGAGPREGTGIRGGLLGTGAETIPVQRVQAVRVIEPLLWRPLQWCRLEVDVAGSPGRDSADGTARMRKTLLPVGRRDETG